MSVPSSELAPPPPLPEASVSPPPWNLMGGNTRLWERVWGEPIWTTGGKAWHSMYSILCDIDCIVHYVLFNIRNVVFKYSYVNYKNFIKNMKLEKYFFVKRKLIDKFYATVTLY